MKGSYARVLVGLALASTTVVALLAQQEARSLRRLSITGGFTSSFNAERTELALAPGDGPIDGVEVRAPEGGGLSVAREPIPGSDKRRLVITLAAGGPAPERAREQAAGGASEPAPAQDREPAPGEREPVPAPAREPGPRREREPAQGKAQGRETQAKTAPANAAPAKTAQGKTAQGKAAQGNETCECGRDIEGKCLSCPQTLSCTALPDDPPGLLREGFGCDAKGGSGTGVIRVTALGPDGAPGSLRWAYGKVNARNRRVVFDPLSGDVVLDTPLYWNKPYTTLDFSAADVTVVARKRGTNALVFTATHDLVVYSGRGRGHWKPDPAWIPVNNAGNFTLDGDGGPTRYEWDDLWDATSPVLRRGVRNSIFDRNTLSGCEDDCLACWEGVRDVSFTRNLVHDSFHPSTTGAKGAPLPPGRERLRISWLYNVAARNGERNIAYPREETYWWVVGRNVFFGWATYPYKDWETKKTETSWSVGLHISDMYTNENDYGWVVANAFVPEGSEHKEWGITIGSNLGCENAPKCCAPDCTAQSGRDITCCNPRMKKTHWWFEANEGAAGGGITNPKGYEPPPLPFAVDKARPWPRVLAEAGVVKRNATEQALVDAIAAGLPSSAANP